MIFRGAKLHPFSNMTKNSFIFSHLTNYQKHKYILLFFAIQYYTLFRN